MNKTLNLSTLDVDGIDLYDYPDFVDAYVVYAEYMDGTVLTEDELDAIDKTIINNHIHSTQSYTVRED